MEIKKIAIKHFSNQKPGTSGLRKKTKEFMQEGYVESYIQSVFNSIDVLDKSFVIGGDGRYYNSIALKKTIAIAITNNVKNIYIAKNGLISTPAISNFVLKYKLDFGIMLSASHNPAGIDGDFGIKINTSNGAPANLDVTNKIYEESLKISEYSILDNFDIDLSKEQKLKILNTEILVFDGVIDYANKMEEIFDFKSIKELLKKDDFNIAFNGFYGVTGIFAKEIFGNRLGIDKKYLLNVDSKEDFGGLAPDPNPVSAKAFLDYVANNPTLCLGLACDADGDRNMIFSKRYNLEPSDSLAIMLEYSHLIDYYKDIKGVARSSPTSSAVDLVAKELGIDCYCVPTGWKFFANLLDNDKITFCGEESFGTGSCHSREKDGIWSLLFWLHIIAKSNKSFDEILESFWDKYGRVFFSRHDIENLKDGFANILVSTLENNAKNNIDKIFYGDYKVESVEHFSYTDITNNETVSDQGLVIKFNKQAKVVVRISGTVTSGGIVRLYLTKYCDIAEQTHLKKDKYLKSFADALYSLLGYDIKPSMVV